MTQTVERSVVDGRQRVIIERVSPEIDAGRFPIKRTLGEKVTVEADIFADGHDVLSATLRYLPPGQELWLERPMEPVVNDRWSGSFYVESLGNYRYTVMAWIDPFKSWRRDLEKKFKAGQDIAVECLAGAELLAAAALNADGKDAEELKETAASLSGDIPAAGKVAIALSPALGELMETYSSRHFPTVYPRELVVSADPVLARFSAWYEMFPRSCADTPGRHGTFRDVEARLPRIAEMGFDILYFPPIHPIGRTFRKGKNNQPTAQPGDPGSPWGIGSEEGGHKSIHPELGTLDDFRRLVRRAKELGLEVALDIAFQCSPDHPYVKEHPEWFKRRPDGSIQYAENPPKKYQDIYPIHFETPDWESLWAELKSIFEFWIAQGISVFRVDNPHTKSFYFWEWCIRELKRRHPHLILLSEAFTRPKVMYYLAKLGFNQSYNYFPWRNSKWELTEYLTELTQTEVREFFRPNLWPNTPDILTQYLQYGGRPAFMIRLILAATLGASYGIYGPPFELCENEPREPGSEEYLNSEKYEIRHFDLNKPGNLTDLITRVNRIRRENPALHSNDRLMFHPTDNEHLLAYSKTSENLENVILTVVNLDPDHVHRGWVNLALEPLGMPAQGNYQAHDLLTHARFLWNGPHNFIELNPQFVPAHIFRLRRYVRSERDFDYFM